MHFYKNARISPQTIYHEFGRKNSELVWKLPKKLETQDLTFTFTTKT